MTNPNTRFITEELDRRATNAENIYYEVPDEDNGRVWRVRDRVARVVDKITGEERNEDRYDVLGKALDTKRKKGFIKRMFGWAGKRLSRLFRGEPTMVGNTEMPDRNQPDFLRVVSTMEDVLPMSDVIETYSDPDGIDIDGMPDGPQRAHAQRSRDLKGELRDLLDDDAVRDPEMAFVYRDLENEEMLADYRYAITALTPPPNRDVEAESARTHLATVTAALRSLGADVSTRLDAEQRGILDAALRTINRSLQERFGGNFEALRNQYNQLRGDHDDAEVVPEVGRTQVEYDDANNRILTPLGFAEFCEAQTALDNVGGDITAKVGEPLSTHLGAIANVATTLSNSFPPAPAGPERQQATPPTIFQIRVLAMARRFARERYALSGTRPQGYDQVIHPDDFKRAYVQAYLDGFGFESEDLRKATLDHAIRRIEGDNAKDSVDLDWILKKSPLPRRVRKALQPDMSDEDLSRAIADGKILVDEIPRIIVLLRAALRSGRAYGRDITLDENFGPLMLKLHKMHRLYAALNEIEGMDEVALRSSSEIFLRLVEREADQAREVLRDAARNIVGEPPVAEDEDYEAVSDSGSSEDASSDGAEGDEQESTEGKKDFSTKLAERIEKLRENPAVVQLMHFGGGFIVDLITDRIRNVFSRQRRRRRRH